MRRFAPLLLVVLVAAACGGPSTDTVGTVSPATSAPEPVAPSSTMAPNPTLSAESPFGEALAATQAASAYAFEATVSLFPASGEVKVELSGWVDGADRELLVTAGDQTVKTLVLDGVATVIGPDGATEIPLAEAPTGPSLGLLGMVQVTEEGPGMVRGVLPAAAVPDFGQGDTEPVDAQITIFYEDVITGYQLADPGNSWVVEVTFANVGESQTPNA